MQMHASRHESVPRTTLGVSDHLCWSPPAVVTRVASRSSVVCAAVARMVMIPHEADDFSQQQRTEGKPHPSSDKRRVALVVEGLLHETKVDELLARRCTGAVQVSRPARTGNLVNRDGQIVSCSDDAWCRRYTVCANEPARRPSRKTSGGALA